MAHFYQNMTACLKLSKKVRRPVVCIRIIRRCLTTRLAEVGILESLKEEAITYETGQLFLHRVFGYRGIVLFSWLTRVYDRDLAIKTEDKSNIDPTSATGREVKGKSNYHYQVLIDSRDTPYIRAQTNAVTYLSNQENKSSPLYAIPGLDYVAHEDILPYTSEEKHPIQHDLFSKFLNNKPGSFPSFIARDALHVWQEKNHPWLQLSEVHRERTENVRVTVMPFYIGKVMTVTPFYIGKVEDTKHKHMVEDTKHKHMWRYSVRLENMTDECIQLRERHWSIFSLSGKREILRGSGVVGQEPVLSKDSPAFQYSSHVSLKDRSGHMWGAYKMEKRDGSYFDCKIPPFALESEVDDNLNPEGLVDS